MRTAIRPAIIVVSVFTIAISTVWAQPVYKSVDKEGNITYSSTPPEDAKHVEDTGIVSSHSDPNTDPEDDVERVKQAAEELERDRKARESRRAKQKEAAAQEPPKAPAEKTIIQRQRPIFQQPIPPGGSKPTPPPNTKPPVVPVPPSPSPPVAVPLGGGGGN
jgi:hypothetical protein